MKYLLLKFVKKMMKLILNENKFNVLLEYAGFVNGWQKLIDYIYETSLRNLNMLIRKIVPLQYRSQSKAQVFDYLENSDYISLDNPMQDLVISENHLNKLNIFGIKQITINYTIDDDLAGAFNNQSMHVGEDGKLDNFTIIVNLKPLYVWGEKYKQTLQHELTHAYEMLKKYKTKGETLTNRNFGNKHYSNNPKGIVNGMSYYFSKVEMNAVISEAAYMLQQYNPRTEEECWKLLREGDCGEFLNVLTQIKNGLETNISYTYSVIEFLRMNPEHIDMFPNPRNNNVKSYQKRLVRSAEFKINYFMKKLTKIVKVYLQRKGVVR